MITGNVFDGSDRSFVEKVKVYNLQNGDSSITNERGYFRVKGNKGDSIIFSRDYFITTSHIVDNERHITVKIYLDARTLPQVDVYGNRVIIPINVGNVSSMRSLGNRPAGPGKIYSGLANNELLQPGLTLDGPISYFMRSERYKRQYARKLEFKARQQDYLDLIQSDSVMQVVKEDYQLTEQELDDLIIEFNLYHSDHQFLDMDTKTVEKLLRDFLNKRTRYSREAPIKSPSRNPFDHQWQKPHP